MGGCIDWWIYGEWDSDRLVAKLREYSPTLSGALFGAGWWVLVDVIAYIQSVLSENFPWTYVLPGIAATLALVCMNLVSREELAEMSDSAYDEGASMRARCWLFFSFMVSFGSVAGAVAVLLKTTGSGEHVQVGVAGLIETGAILASGLLLWAFRTQADDGYLLTY